MSSRVRKVGVAKIPPFNTHCPDMNLPLYSPMCRVRRDWVITVGDVTVRP